MTTWKEALNAFRADRAQAEKLKELRDSLIRDLMKKPSATNTGRTLQNEEILRYNLTLRN